MQQREPLLPTPQTPQEQRPAIQRDHSYWSFHCDFPRCDQMTDGFATWLINGQLLGHYCDSHSDQEVEALWRELAEAPLDWSSGDTAFYRQGRRLGIHSRPDGDGDTGGEGGAA